MRLPAHITSGAGKQVLDCEPLPLDLAEVAERPGYHIESFSHQANANEFI